jgi:hypothetical protein
MIDGYLLNILGFFLMRVRKRMHILFHSIYAISRNDIIDNGVNIIVCEDR